MKYFMQLIKSMFLIVLFSLLANSCAIFGNRDYSMDNMAPEYLYKVVSLEDWRNCKCNKFLNFSGYDDPGVHFAEFDQVDMFRKKYFKNESRVVVLKVKSDMLMGNLEKEDHPDGSVYYHLFDGKFPRNSVVSFEEVPNM